MRGALPALPPREGVPCPQPVGASGHRSWLPGAGRSPRAGTPWTDAAGHGVRGETHGGNLPRIASPLPPGQGHPGDPRATRWLVMSDLPARVLPSRWGALSVSPKQEVKTLSALERSRSNVATDPFYFGGMQS